MEYMQLVSIITRIYLFNYENVNVTLLRPYCQRRKIGRHANVIDTGVRLEMRICQLNVKVTKCVVLYFKAILCASYHKVS